MPECVCVAAVPLGTKPFRTSIAPSEIFYSNVIKASYNILIVKYTILCSLLSSPASGQWEKKDEQGVIYSNVTQGLTLP